MSIHPIGKMVIPYAGEVPEDGRFLIHPERAREWIARYNTKNRHVRPWQVDNIAAIQKRGEWIYNAEPVVFSVTWKIINAQHRLLGCIKSGIPLDTDVRIGIADEAFYTYDSHTRRSNADYVSADGRTNTYRLAAVIAWVWRWETGSLINQNIPSSQQAIDIDRRHPELSASSRDGQKIAKAIGLSSAVCGFVHYVCGLIDTAKRDEFFDSLETGIGFHPGSPVRLLRERLNKNAREKAKLPPIQILALFIKAWNAHRAGRSMSMLRWRQDGDQPEQFPEFEQ